MQQFHGVNSPFRKPAPTMKSTSMRNSSRAASPRSTAQSRWASALREATALPIPLHTHDPSGAAAASVLAAIDAGVDAVDAAIAAMSGTTSQPCLGSIVEALRHTDRDSGLDTGASRHLSFYWEAVRLQYAAFESDLKAGASEVYVHEMPGRQFTNLREQARSLGLETRWHEVADAYAAANRLLGDIVKVTPSSKVVGDMALLMVSQDLSASDVLDPGREIAFPSSVVDMLRGDLGQPPGGWPEAIQRKVLKDEVPYTVRPGALLAPADLDAERAAAAAGCGRPLTDEELASYLMYPRVFEGFFAAREKFGPASALPTPVYFYGMAVGEEITVEIERGKSLVIRLLAVGNVDDEGIARLFFELNGQPRSISVPHRTLAAGKISRRIADPTSDSHVAAPMPGAVATLSAIVGQQVQPGDLLMTLEAMKMETAVVAPRAGRVSEIAVAAGQSVEAKDLLVVLAD